MHMLYIYWFTITSTHSPNVSMYCVFALGERLCVNDNTKHSLSRARPCDSIATGDSMSMVTFFYVFHLKFGVVGGFSLALFTHQYGCVCVYWCCVCTKSLVVLKIIFIHFFFTLICWSAKNQQRQCEWQRHTRHTTVRVRQHGLFSIFQLQATCF